MATQATLREYRAAVLGGTGAVGGALVRELLASPKCIGVTAFVRRRSPELESLPDAQRKLDMRVVSMDNLRAETSAILANLPPHAAAFCTLGVGQPRKVSAEEHWRVDVEYASAFAAACRDAGVESFSLLTSVGADAKSRSRYLYVKGAVEAAVVALHFPRASFFRPSLIVTPSVRYGLQDWLTQAIFPRISWLLPSRFHEVTVDELARAMRVNAERPSAKAVEILEYPDYVRLLSASNRRQPQ